MPDEHEDEPEREERCGEDVAEIDRVRRERQRRELRRVAEQLRAEPGERAEEERSPRGAIRCRGRPHRAAGANDGADRRAREGEVGYGRARLPGGQEPFERVRGEGEREGDQVLTAAAHGEDLPQVSHVGKARERPARHTGDSPCKTYQTARGTRTGDDPRTVPRSP